ncbi:glycosyltransferase family 4 protein [Allofournierella massiliensis]|uniref:glycosyltransferase family 4 protein n=1 Tax=Allofournierella massiliensis TaxID=1650663 RepID=UPI0024B06A0D|nr:glycosyltransferase family 4 protein [Fournierella massiliensis]
MKRILVVSQHFWPEPFRINDIVEGFVEDGLEVDVLCGLPNYPRGEWFSGYRYTGPRRENYKGARVFRAGEIPRKGNSGAMIFLNYVSWPFFALFNLWRLKGPYDAVLCYNTSPVLMNFPAIVYAKLHRIPFTSYVLDIWPENLYSVLPVQNGFLRRIASAVSDWHYKRADRLIAMSLSLKKRLMERTGKPADRVAVIPQHCEDFYAVPQPDKELAERYAGRFNLVFTGNFSPAQSLDTVIRAAVKARGMGAENLRLLMVGDGMSRNALEALVDELNARDTVVFTGSVPPADVPRYTTLAHGLVASLSASPDLGMTVPAKIASYMAAAKPLLASMDGEGARAVEAAGCGFASPAEDSDALAKNMLALYQTGEAERAALGQKAFAWYQTNYRRRAVLDQLEDFLLPTEKTNV